MERRTTMAIGCLVLLAAIPISVLALIAPDTSPTCCGQAPVCGACDANDCTCPDGTDCTTGNARTEACRPSGCCGAAAGCGC